MDKDYPSVPNSNISINEIYLSKEITRFYQDKYDSSYNEKNIMAGFINVSFMTILLHHLSGAKRTIARKCIM